MLTISDNFKSKYSEDQRRSVSNRILERYPDRVPIIVLRATSKSPAIDRRKYIVHRDSSVHKFHYELRKYIRINEHQSIFIFVNGKLPVPTLSIGELYHRYKDKDGFLYISYDIENTFG